MLHKTPLEEVTPPVLLTLVIEKYVQHARFFIICNDIGKVSGAIQSRCMLFRFAPLLPEQMMHRLEHVIESEKYGTPKF